MTMDSDSGAWKKLASFHREDFAYVVAALACREWATAEQIAADLRERYAVDGPLTETVWLAQRLALAFECDVLERASGDPVLHHRLTDDVRREVALVGAVGWWRRQIDRRAPPSSFKTFGADRAWLIGDPVYVVVDSVNSPIGVWEGRVSRIEPGYAAPRPRATVDDLRLLTQDGGRLAHLHGTEWGGSYRVYPRDSFTADLFADVARLEAELQGQRRAAALREEVYKGALQAVCAGQVSTAAKEAYERGLRDAEAAAVKSKEGRPSGG